MLCKCSQKQHLAADVQHLKGYGVQSRAGEANRQVFLPLCPAKSAPFRQRGWRPSEQQSKLNLQMCLWSKYLSPAGYYLSLMVSGQFSPKKQSASSDVEWKAKSIPYSTHEHMIHLKKFTECQKELLDSSFFHAGLEKALPQSKLTFHFCHQEIIRVEQKQHYCPSHLPLQLPKDIRPNSSPLEAGYSLTGSVENVTHGKAFYGPTTASADVLSDLYPRDGLGIDKPCFISREASSKTQRNCIFIRELVGLTVLLSPLLKHLPLCGKIPGHGLNSKTSIWVCCILQGGTCLETFSPELGNSHCQHRNAQVIQECKHQTRDPYTTSVIRHSNTSPVLFLLIQASRLNLGARKRYSKYEMVLK